MNTPHFLLRQALPDDARTLALLAAATFLESYAGWLPGSAILDNCFANHTTEAWQLLLQMPGCTAWLASVEPEAAPVGYAQLIFPPEMPAELLEPGDAELKRIYLFSRFHGIGAGQALIHAAIRHAGASGARRLLLGTHKDNARAIRFYQRNGFSQVGTRQFRVGCCDFEDPVFALALP